jgi:hypothetical protein
MNVEDLERGRAELASGVRQRIDEAPWGLSRAIRDLERFARARPVIATFAALTAGFLVARVLARYR